MSFIKTFSKYNLKNKFSPKLKKKHNITKKINKKLKIEPDEQKLSKFTQVDFYCPKRNIKIRYFLKGQRPLFNSSI